MKNKIRMSLLGASCSQPGASCEPAWSEPAASLDPAAARLEPAFALHFEAFSNGCVITATEATQFTTQHNRFKTRRIGLSIDGVVDSVVDSVVDHA